MGLRVHDEGLARRVGAVVLVVIAAVVIVVTTMRDRLRGGGTDVRVYFAGATGLSEGAAVRVAGRDVGEITGVSIVPAHRTWRGHPLEGTGGVVVAARLDPDWAARIPSNAELFVGARSMLAPRYLEIAPPRGAPARPLREGDELRGVDPPDLDRILTRIWDNLNDTQRFIDAIRPSSEALEAAIARLAWTLGHVGALDLGGVRDELTVLLAEVEAADLSPDAILGLVDRARGTVARIEAAVADLRGRAAVLAAAIDRVRARIPADLGARIDAALAAVDDATRGAGELLAGLRGVLDDATTGTGTLAALARDAELIDDLKAMTKMMKRKPWRVVVKP